jgi:antitoxin FitA
MRIRWSIAMTITFELPENDSKNLSDMALRLGISPEELAKAALAGVLSQNDQDFLDAAKYVFEKNQELYRRLS